MTDQPAAKIQRLTGAVKFGDDLEPHGALHGAFVRLPEARARLLDIDATGALELDGVVAVFTADDFGTDGPPRFGAVVADQPILAHRETKYCGEPVAIVVAQTRDVAIEGAALVRVEREPLLGWHTAAGALAGDALHPGDYPALGHSDGPNVMGRWDYGWGDVPAAERQSAIVVENTYHVPFAHHFAIETYSAAAMSDGNGITVWDTVQHPFALRRVLATMLDLPISDVRVVATPMGGSFGSKGYPKLGPVVAAVSRLLGRPVKITLSGEEAFYTGQREACDILLRTGFDADGHITFQDLHADFLVGAYTDISTRVVSKAGLHAAGPYRTPAARLVARGLYTTTPPTTAFRGFGAAHMVLALEGQLDDAACRLGVDPVQLRLLNMKEKGEPTVEGETPVDGDWPELVRMAARELNWESGAPAGIGRGLAFGMKSCVPATTSQAAVQMASDGSVTALVGTTEMGQGAVLTYATLVADWLGIGAERVTVRMADTAAVPFDALTASSRSLVHMGRALQDAVDDLTASIREHAATFGDVDPSEVAVTQGVVKAGDWQATYAELMTAVFGAGQGELTGKGQFRSPSDPDHVLGGRTPFFEAVVTAVEVSVDAETGFLQIHRAVHVTDAGRILNRPRAIGLDEGGVVMGMGLACSEQLVYRDGQLLNAGSLDYRIPTAPDIPAVSVSLFQENGDGPGPHGSKGLGEGGILAIAPALAAAVHDCTGVRICDLPITAEKIWTRMQDLKGDS